VKNLPTAVCLLLTGCLGYHVGPVKPGVLRDVHLVAVPTFENKTLLPRVEVLVTDSVIKQLQQDGTYKIADQGNADAVLKAEITEINRTPARSVRGNVLATTEFNLAMHVRYKLETRGGTLLMPMPTLWAPPVFSLGLTLRPTSDRLCPWQPKSSRPIL
jgi:hypothetical protein